MNIKNILALTAIASLTSLPVYAGSSVTNSHTVRRSHGTGSVVSDFHRTASGVQVNRSNSVKIDAAGGDWNDASLNFKGGEFHGSAYTSSENNSGVPFVAGSFTSQFERVDFNERQNTTAVENYRFSEVGTDITVSSDSF